MERTVVRNAVCRAGDSPRPGPGSAPPIGSQMCARSTRPVSAIFPGRSHTRAKWKATGSRPRLEKESRWFSKRVVLHPEPGQDRAEHGLRLGCGHCTPSFPRHECYKKCRAASTAPLGLVDSPSPIGIGCPVVPIPLPTPKRKADPSGFAHPLMPCRAPQGSHRDLPAPEIFQGGVGPPKGG
jgi:hypothetical protein